MGRELKMKSTLYGEYVLNQYFFKVYARGSKPIVFNQVEFQKNHLSTLIHEYLHYAHEVSTHVGTVGLVYALSMRELLSRHMWQDESSSEISMELSLEDVTAIESISRAINIIMGDNFGEISGPVRTILGYGLQQMNVGVPDGDFFVDIELEVPLVRFFDGTELMELSLCKFFIYEGLAYGLEQVNEKNNGTWKRDELDGTEYTLIRYLARHIVPGISDHCFLTLASLSLAYFNCGQMFIGFLRSLGTQLEMGVGEDLFIAKAKSDTSREYKRQMGQLRGVLQEIKISYRLRSSLSAAVKELSKSYLDAAAARIKKPSFEVDLIFENKIAELFEVLPPCSYKIVYEGEDEYDRDFYGTNKFREKNGLEKSRNHNIWIAHVHYSNAMFHRLIGEIIDDDLAECPFFSVCKLDQRIHDPRRCASEPWTNFDIAVNGDRGFCWYAEGVLLSKGNDTPA